MLVEQIYGLERFTAELAGAVRAENRVLEHRIDLGASGPLEGMSNVSDRNSPRTGRHTTPGACIRLGELCEEHWAGTPGGGAKVS